MFTFTVVNFKKLGLRDKKIIFCIANIFIHIDIFIVQYRSFGGKIYHLIVSNYARSLGKYEKSLVEVKFVNM